MKLNTDGDLYLSGALARIRDRDNVGITSNVFDDMINNFDGAVYWFKGIQGGRLGRWRRPADETRHQRRP